VVNKLFLFLCLLSICVWADESATRAKLESNVIPTNLIVPWDLKERTDREQKLPDTDTQEFDGLLSDLFGRFHFSEKLAMKNSAFVTGKDPILAELALMDRFMDEVEQGKIPLEEARLNLTRYHIADERVLSRVERAVKLGIPMDIVTDFNDSVDVEFLAGEKLVTDFSMPRVKPNDSPNGKMLQKFLDLGFKYGNKGERPKYGLYSQPVYRRTDEAGNKADIMIDIMHEKSVIAMRVKDGKVIWAEATAGSANMAAHSATTQAAKKPDMGSTRVNLVREIKSQALAKKRAQHAQALVDTFANGGKIKDLPTENLFRINTKDGWVETGFTNGKHNIYDRLAAMILHSTPGVDLEFVKKYFDRGVESYYERIAAEFGGWKMEEARELQFVNTHGEIHKAEQLQFENDKDAKALRLFDAKFNSVTGYGYPPTFLGVSLHRAMGGTVRPLTEEVARRNNIQIYLRGIEGMTETDLDGPPISRYLLHTKTYVMRGKMKDGRVVTVIFDGSFNKSNHEENAEDQDLIVAFGKSKIADGYWNLAPLLVKAQAEFLYNGYVALVMDTLGAFTGHNALKEVPRTLAEEIIKTIALGDIKLVKQKIEDLADLPSSLSRRPSREKIQDGIDKFISVLEKHKEWNPRMYGKGENFYLRKLIEIAAIQSHPEMNEKQAAWAIRNIVRTPSFSVPEKVDARAAEIWKMIGRETPFPPRAAVVEGPPDIKVPKGQTRAAPMANSSREPKSADCGPLERIAQEVIKVMKR